MYCISLNLMRQSIAISICILSYHFFDNKKYKKSIILLIMAFMFHKTALIFIIILFINYIIKSKIKNKIIIISMIILLGLFATIFMDKIVSITSYSEYLNQSNLMRDFSVGSILKKLFWVALGGFCILSINKQSKIDNKNFIIALIISIISLMLTITSFKIPGTGRLGYYFNDISYFLIIYEISNTFKQRKFVLIVLITLLFGLWWNMTAVKNDSSNVYPYKTSIIKFLN